MLLYFFFLRFSSLATIYSIIGTQGVHMLGAILSEHVVVSVSSRQRDHCWWMFSSSSIVFCMCVLTSAGDELYWWWTWSSSFQIMFNVRLITMHALLFFSLIVVAANYVKFTCNLYILFVNDANILCCRLCWCYCWPSCSWHGLLASLALA